MSGLRFAQIHHGLDNPFNRDMPLLEYVLVKREQAQAGVKPKPRLPITLDILKKLKNIWMASTGNSDTVMLWAAACTGFFGFLRAGEFTIPSPQVHLNLSDLAVDRHSNPSLFRLRIKQSKTDPFHQGVEIFLGATNTDICPVQALLQYLGARSPHQGPLFVFSSGSPLTRSALVSALHTALQQAGCRPEEYNGHSFRIGAATTAAQKGLEDSLIQTLGRWKSAAFKSYIKLQRSQLAAVSIALAS